MKVRFICGRVIRAGIQTFRLSPKSALGPWETVKFESCGGAKRRAPPQISQSPKDPARAWEGLNVGPSLSTCVAKQTNVAKNKFEVDGKKMAKEGFELRFLSFWLETSTN